MEPIVTGIQGCARCGKDHEELTFAVLTNPPAGITHWADCPVAHQPILMRIATMQALPDIEKT